MKKKYPEYEERIDMCCEHVADPIAVQSHCGVVAVHDVIDDLDWENFPSYGPATDEEAKARIDVFEEKLNNNQVNWISSDEFDRQLFEKFPWLR